MKIIKNIFVHFNLFCIFAVTKPLCHFFVACGINIKNNTPSRLAEMQHTWGVFSFIPNQLAISLG
jgi:hypothetical protein